MRGDGLHFAAADLRHRGQQLARVACHGRRVEVQLAHDRRHDAAGCSTSVTSRCSGVISACVRLAGEALRRDEGFLCLFCQLVRAHVVIHALRRGLGSVLRVAQLAPARRSAPAPSATASEGSCDVHPANRLPFSVRSHAMASRSPRSRNTWPFCVSGGTFSRAGVPASVGTFDLATQHGRGDRHRHVHVQVLALALEHGVRRQPDPEIQIACRRRRRCRARLRPPRARASRRPPRPESGRPRIAASPLPRWNSSRRVVPAEASSSVSSSSCSTSRPARARVRRRPCAPSACRRRTW